MRNVLFCKSEIDKTDGESVEELMKRVEVNDAGAIFVLGNDYQLGVSCVQQDYAKAMELYTRAADLGYSKAHFALGISYRAGGDLKKSKFHYEAAAMAGHEDARLKLGNLEGDED